MLSTHKFTIHNHIIIRTYPLNLSMNSKLVSFPQRTNLVSYYLLALKKKKNLLWHKDQWDHVSSSKKVGALLLFQMFFLI